MRKKLLIMQVIGCFLLCSTMSANASLNIVYMIWMGTANDGTTTGVHNSTLPILPGSSWKLFVEQSSTLSGNFLNIDNTTGINVALEIGSHAFSFAGTAWPGDSSSKRTCSALIFELYNDVTLETGYLGVWGPMNTNDAFTGPPPGFFASEGAGYMNASSVYRDSQFQVVITDYLYSKDGIMGYQDWVGIYTVGSDGWTDTVGRVGLNVLPIPEPATLFLLTFGGLVLRRRKV